MSNFKNLRDIFWDNIYQHALKDRNIVIVSADLGAIALDQFRQNLPQQFINVGISEQNAITVGAGLALQGKRVYVYACAPFIYMRCYEQIKLMVSGMNIPLTIVGQGAGFSYWESGHTHYNTEDIGCMRLLPHLDVFSLSDAAMTQTIANYTIKSNKASYIRLDRSAPELLYEDSCVIDINKGFHLFNQDKLKDYVLIVACGNIVHMAKEATTKLREEGIACVFLDLFSVHPDLEQLKQVLENAKAIVVVEEHCQVGGIGSLLCECMIEYSIIVPMCRLSCDTRNGYWNHYGSRENILAHYGITVENIVTQAQALLKK